MLRILLSLFGLFATLSPAQAPPSQAQIDGTTIRTNVTLVQVDAIVTDTKDRQVTDLEAGDFEILQDGKPQVVTHCSYISIKPGVTRAVTVAMPKDTSVPPPPLPVGVTPDQVRRTVALVVDDLGLSFASIAQLRSALEKFVGERMESGDLVAILRTGAGVGALQQFTTDKRMLYAAIDRVRHNALGRIGVSSFAPFQAVGTFADTPVADEERQTDFSVGTLGALRYVVDGLRELPGRKTVVLFTENIRLFTGEGTNDRVMRSVRRLADAANRSGVVINTIDPRGVQTLSLTAADDAGGRRPEEVAQLPSQRSQEHWDSQEGLSFLAEETGGRFMHDSNDIDGSLRKVMEDSEGYYLVGYEPDASAFDPKTGRALFHTVKVKVKTAGLQVRSRRARFGNSDPDAPLVPQGRDAQLARALASPFGSGAIPLRLTSLFNSEPERGSFVTSLLHLDGKALTFLHEPDGHHKAVFDVVVKTFGDNGQEENSSSTTYTMRLRSEMYDQALESGLVYSIDHPVKKAGAYQLRVALRDATSEKVGTASQFIEVPDVGKGRLLLSGIVLRADMDGDPKATPAVRVFKPGKTMIYGYQVLNARGGPGQPPQLESQMRLFRDGQAFYSGVPQVVKGADQPDPKHLMAAGRIQLGADIAAGDYVLQVVVTDKLAKGVATQSIDFTVE